MTETTATRRWVDVGASDEIPEGEARTYDIDDERIAVCRANEQLYAVQDLCTHDDGPLGEGELDGFAIQCPRHGARFDVRTGSVLRMPAVMPIETYPVMEKDGRVMVGVRERSEETEGDDDW